MKKAEIKDRPGNESAELTAMSMLIPRDWTLQGAPEYPVTADCNFTYGRIRLHASSPDGLTGIRAIPMRPPSGQTTAPFCKKFTGRTK